MGLCLPLSRGQLSGLVSGCLDFLLSDAHDTSEAPPLHPAGIKETSEETSFTRLICHVYPPTLKIHRLFKSQVCLSLFPQLEEIVTLRPN